MDKNKLEKLKAVGYQPVDCCKFCTHADLSGDGWGYCNLHTYQHQKHNEEISRLSITEFGVCKNFQRNFVKTCSLGAFAALLP